MELAYIPSPSRGVIHLGPIPLRGYAFCIIIGVFVAVWLANRRWVARGGRPGTVGDIAVWAVLFGLVGARLYHVCTTYEPYFGKGGHPVDALKIWDGGLGIWGAVALGALGAWIACRRRGIPMPAYADAAAPGIVLAQGIGRWGNWFNQELFGKPSKLPWALKIDLDKRPAGYLGDATFHPTFLYESLWCLLVAALVLWADRRFRLGHGRAFALYAAAYTVGRFYTEYLRIDEAHRVGGLRLNEWTCVVVFVAAVAYLWLSAKRRPGREEVVEPAAAADGTGTESGDQDPSEEPAVTPDKDAGGSEPAGEESAADGSDGSDGSDDGEGPKQGPEASQVDGSAAVKSAANGS